MIDERTYELLCCQMDLVNGEKAGVRKQVNELIARLKAIEEFNKENSKALMETIFDKSAMEKSEYDGSDKKKDDDNNKADDNETGGNTSSDNAPAQNTNLQGERKLRHVPGKLN